MTDHAQNRFWSGIDLPKTLAGTLAAVSAAVAGSFLGIAGTLIGAAVASLISSLGTELYYRSIDRGKKKLQSAFIAAPAAVGTPEVPAAPEPPSEVNGPTRRIRWKRVGLVAAVLFVLGLGTLTTVELLAGRSAADALTGRDGGSAPSLFNTSGNSSDSSNPSEEEQVTPAPTGETSSEPTVEASQPEGSAPPSEQPTATVEPEPTQPGPTSTVPAQPEGDETGAAG